MQQDGDVELLLGELIEDLVALLFVGGVDVEVLRLTAQFFDVAADLGDMLEAPRMSAHFGVFTCACVVSGMAI